MARAKSKKTIDAGDVYEVPMLQGHFYCLVTAWDKEAICVGNFYKLSRKDVGSLLEQRPAEDCLWLVRRFGSLGIEKSEWRKVGKAHWYEASIDEFGYFLNCGMFSKYIAKYDMKNIDEMSLKSIRSCEGILLPTNTMFGHIAMEALLARSEKERYFTKHEVMERFF